MLSRIMLRMLRLLFRPPEEEQLGEIEGRRKEETACACAVSPMKTVCAMLRMLVLMIPEVHREDVPQSYKT